VRVGSTCNISIGVDTILKWFSDLIYPHEIIALKARYAAWVDFENMVEQRIKEEYPEKAEEMLEKLLA